MQSSLKRFFAGILVVAMIVTAQSFSSLAVNLDTRFSGQTKKIQELDKKVDTKYYEEYLKNNTQLLMKGDNEDSSDGTTMSTDISNDVMTEKTSTDNIKSENDLENDSENNSTKNTKNDDDKNNDDENNESTNIQIDIDDDNEILEKNDDFVGPMLPLQKNDVIEEEIITITEDEEKDVEENKQTASFGAGADNVLDMKGDFQINNVTVKHKDTDGKRTYYIELTNEFCNYIRNIVLNQIDASFVRIDYDIKDVDGLSDTVPYEKFRRLYTTHKTMDMDTGEYKDGFFADAIYVGLDKNGGTLAKLAHIEDPISKACTGFYVTRENDDIVEVHFAHCAKKYLPAYTASDSINLHYIPQYKVEFVVPDNIKRNRDNITIPKEMLYLDNGNGVYNYYIIPKTVEEFQKVLSVDLSKINKINLCLKSDPDYRKEGAIITADYTSNLEDKSTWEMKKNYTVDKLEPVGDNGVNASYFYNANTKKYELYLYGTEYYWCHIDKNDIGGVFSSTKWDLSWIEEELSIPIDITNNYQCHVNYQTDGGSFINKPRKTQNFNCYFFQIPTNDDIEKKGKTLTGWRLNNTEEIWIIPDQNGAGHRKDIIPKDVGGIEFTLTAVWTDKEYDKIVLEWDLNGGKWNSDAAYVMALKWFPTGKTLSSAKNEFISISNIIAPDGYKFDKWTVTYPDGSSDEFTDELYFKKVEKAKIKANWRVLNESDYVTPTWDLNGGKWKEGSESWETKKFLIGKTLNTDNKEFPNSEEIIAPKNYIFDKWIVTYSDGSSEYYTSNYLCFKKGQNVTVKTNWRYDPNSTECKVTWDLNGGKWKEGSEHWATKTIFETKKTFSAALGECPTKDDVVAPEGCEFFGWDVIWNGNKKTYTKDLYFNPAENITVKAHWKKTIPNVDDYIDIPRSMMKSGATRQKPILLTKPDKDKWKSQLGLGAYDNIVTLTDADINTDNKTKISTIKYRSSEFRKENSVDLLTKIYAVAYDLNEEDIMIISPELLETISGASDDGIDGDGNTGDIFADSHIIAEVWQDEEAKQYVKLVGGDAVTSYSIFSTTLGDFLPPITIKWDLSDIDISHYEEVDEGQKQEVDEGQKQEYEIEWILDGGTFKEEYKNYETAKYTYMEEFVLPEANALLAPYRKIFDNWTINDEEVTTISKGTKGKVTVKANWSRMVDSFESFSIGKYKQNDIEPTDLEWVILDKVDDKLLLVTKNVIDNQSFNETNDKAGYTDFANSNIRTWLNEDFYNQAFTNKQKQSILDTTIQDTDTSKIFLLNEEEANKYFANDVSRIARATNYAKQTDNDGELLSTKNADTCQYWLMSDDGSGFAPYVTYTGTISEGAMKDSNNIGIRPAMWVKANKIENIKESPLQIITEAIYRNFDTYKEFLSSFFSSLFD